MSDISFLLWSSNGSKNCIFVLVIAFLNFPTLSFCFPVCVFYRISSMIIFIVLPFCCLIFWWEEGIYSGKRAISSLTSTLVCLNFSSDCLKKYFEIRFHPAYWLNCSNFADLLGSSLGTYWLKTAKASSTLFILRRFSIYFSYGVRYSWWILLPSA